MKDETKEGEATVEGGKGGIGGSNVAIIHHCGLVVFCWCVCQIIIGTAKKK